jgi:aryl-alcohol dehydrogenase-like predicted oxidoreductase
MTTSLPTTQLGRTGMHVTRTGFGAWAIGGGGWANAWGNQDDAASIAAIRHAVESGINWIDTAAVYGLGHSEEVVAAALAALPEADRPYVFTKGGLAWDPADRSAAPRRVGAPASIRAEVEASLRRLRVERIDLYQMHWPAEDGTPLEEYWQVFTDLKREGKIRAAVLSNHGIRQLQAAEEIGTVDAIQPRFNPIHRDAADTKPERSSTARWPRACSPARSPRPGRLPSSRVTGGPVTRTSPTLPCRPTWRWPPRCARSQSGTASRRPRWPLPGRWPSPE